MFRVSGLEAGLVCLGGSMETHHKLLEGTWVPGLGLGFKP